MTVRVQFQLRDEVAARLVELAEQQGKSRQAVVQDLIMGTGDGMVSKPRPSNPPARSEPFSKEQQVKS